MPFVLASAAAVFQRLMLQLFGDMPGIVFFQEDILIIGHNVQGHDERLRKVLYAHNQKGLPAEVSKCRFAEKNVPYLRHLIIGSNQRKNFLRQLLTPHLPNLRMT